MTTHGILITPEILAQRGTGRGTWYAPTPPQSRPHHRLVHGIKRRSSSLNTQRVAPASTARLKWKRC